jgi:hypothetical protein
MKSLGLWFVFAVAIRSLCCGDVTKLAANDRNILLDSSRFRELHSTGDLPLVIVKLCGAKLADPGQKWNATDVIIDPRLPGKRLLWAAVGNDYYVVHYERGGIAHSYHILVAKLTKPTPKEVWSAVGGPFNNYPAFVAALRSGKLDDRLDYAH